RRGIKSAFHPYTAAHDLRRDMFDELGVRLQCENIADIDQDQSARSLAAGLQAGSAVTDDQNVLAQFAQNSVIASLKAFAEGGENDDGNDAPNDSKHRQEAAHLVRFEIFPDL